jgi:hypothetical protein
VNNLSPASNARKRPGLDDRSRLMCGLAGILTSLILAGVVSFPFIIQKSWCSSSTFNQGSLPSTADFLICGVPIVTISAVFLPVSLLRRYGLVKLAGAPSPVPAGRYNAVIIASSCLGLLIGGMIFFEGAAHHFCMSPTSIVIQSGYPGRTDTLTWGDLSSVKAWCWTARPRGGRPYQGSTLTLSFRDGEEIPLGLVDGGRILMQDYDQLRKVLKGKSYDYYVNSTVNTSLCPTELYPLLWNWRRE